MKASMIWKITGYWKDGRHVLVPITVGVKGYPTLRLPLGIFVDDLGALEEFARRIFFDEPAHMPSETETQAAIQELFRSARVRSWKALYTTCSCYELRRISRTELCFDRLTQDLQYRGLTGDERYPSLGFDLNVPGQLGSALRQAYYS